MYKAKRGAGGKLEIGQVQPPEPKMKRAKDEFADLDRELERELSASDTAVAPKEHFTPATIPPAPPPHAKAAGLPCEFCDFVAGSAGGLDAHVEARHPSEGAKAPPPPPPAPPVEAASVEESAPAVEPEPVAENVAVEEDLPVDDAAEDFDTDLLAELDVVDEEGEAGPPAE